MSTESVVSQPDIIVTVKLKAAQAYFLRYIAAILADERCTDDGRTSILRGCNATPADMMRIHHELYSATYELLGR
jgi:hypothetical protein